MFFIDMTSNYDLLLLDSKSDSPVSSVRGVKERNAEFSFFVLFVELDTGKGGTAC